MKRDKTDYCNILIYNQRTTRQKRPKLQSDGLFCRFMLYFPQMSRESKIITNAFKNGKKLFAIGNGGSATLADHMIGEMLGHVERDRKPLPAISLTSLATITAIANDYGYSEIFARQLEALGTPGDVLIIFTTSDLSGSISFHSANIYRAFEVGRQKKMKILFAPRKGKSTPDKQNKQTKWMHRVCEEVEKACIVTQ